MKAVTRLRIVGFLLTMLLTARCQTPQERAQEISFKPCPNFGTLLDLPRESVYTREDGTRVLVVKMEAGTFAEVNPDLARGAEAIESKEKLDGFLKTYREICASEPPFLDRIAWAREDKRRRDAEEAEAEAQKLRIRHREQGEKLALELLDLAKQKSDSVRTRRSEKAKLVALEQEIARVRPESFMVAGKVTQKVAGGVEFFGNAIPSGDYSMPGAMVLQKGYGILQNPAENDVPGGLMVYAEQVFFVGQYQGLNVYSREGSTPALAQYKSLLQQRDDLKVELRKLDDDLVRYDEARTVMRNQYPEIPLPPEP